jgi:type IV secretory pathway VirB4 component
MPMLDDQLSQYLDVWGFEKHSILYRDGSLGRVLSIVPADISCWDSGRVNGFVDRLGKFLNGLPEGLDLQIIQDISDGNGALIDLYDPKNSSFAEEIQREISEDRFRRLVALDEERELPNGQLLVVIRLRPVNLEKSSSTLKFWRKRPPQELLGSHFAAAEAKIDLVESDILNQFAAAGLSGRRLDIEEVFERMYWDWNPDRPIAPLSFDSEDVRSSVLLTDLGLNSTGFTLGRCHHRVISLKTMPERTIAGMAQALQGLPFNSKTMLTIQVPNQQKELESLQAQRRVAFSMSQGAGVRDIDSQSKLAGLEYLLEQMIAQGERIFRVSLNIILRHEDLQALDQQVADVLTRIRSLGGAEAMVETLGSFDVFKELAFPNGRAKERAKRMKTSELADFLPLYGNWRGHDSKGILLRSRSGSLVQFDPFSPSLANANQIVSGGSGSGKSFLTNIMMLQMLQDQPKIYIIDIGGSYQKLCSNLGGQYLSLALDTDFAINPFDLSSGQTVPDHRKIKFLVNLIEIMAREEHDSRLSRLLRTELEAAIITTYESHPEPTLSHLISILRKNIDPEIVRLARILAQWASGTAYGSIIDRPTSLELRRPIVCFDLKGLESHPDLQAACLFIITDLVWREIQRDRGAKKFLIFDECWKLLENEAGCQFIGEVFRTFRKYYASAIAISQNIDDFARSKIASAVLPNATTKWILSQKGADLSRLAEVLDLNDQEIGLVQSLVQKRGVFSEAFLMAGDDRSVVAIESTPLEYWIATTDPRDTSLLQRKLAANPEIRETDMLQQLSQQYPHGVSAKEERK